MLRKFIVLAASVAIMSASANAAELLEVSGTVLVNQGKGFRPATGPGPLKPGDRVLVRSNGSARVAYGANRVTIVRANQTFVVPSEAVSYTGAANSSLTDGFGNPPISPEEAIIGGLILGDVGIGIALSGNDHPASP